MLYFITAPRDCRLLVLALTTVVQMKVKVVTPFVLIFSVLSRQGTLECREHLPFCLPLPLIKRQWRCKLLAINSLNGRIIVSIDYTPDKLQQKCQVNRTSFFLPLYQGAASLRVCVWGGGGHIGTKTGCHSWSNIDDCWWNKCWQDSSDRFEGVLKPSCLSSKHSLCSLTQWN